MRETTLVTLLLLLTEKTSSIAKRIKSNNQKRTKDREVNTNY